jgi:hypothetical protein
VTDGPLEIRFSDRPSLSLPGPGTFEGRV